MLNPPDEQLTAGPLCRDGTRETLELSFLGDESAIETLVERLTPVIARRVIRSLVRTGRPATGCRDLIRDLTQDVFLDIFDNDARILRSWHPERGLSLENFVGLVAERRTLKRLGRRLYAADGPEPSWEASARPGASPDPEQETVARSLWLELLCRVEERLTPMGWKMFRLLFVEERSMAEIAGETRLRRDAIYAWRSRLKKLVRAVYEEVAQTESPAAETLPGRWLRSARGGVG